MMTTYYNDSIKYNEIEHYYNGVSYSYRFTPPTVEEGPAGFGRLFWRYRITRADTILVNGTVVTAVRTPGVDQTLEADYYYLGGHVYDITQTERDILVSAGYAANISIV